METIHLKTTDPVSQILLQSAAGRGVQLNWERYEKLQPQDGFLRLGLSCPYGCLQGPCRIDPFERGPRQGCCGLERDGMVAAMLLRICLQGALDACGIAAQTEAVPAVSFSAPLDEMVTKALVGFGQRPLSTAEIFQAASLLQRPGVSHEYLLQQALRLCLITLGLVDQKPAVVGESELDCRAGYGLTAGDDVRIGLSGRIAPGLLATLSHEVRQHAAQPVQLVSLGEWLALPEHFIPITGSSAEAELLVSAGGVSLLVAGPGTDPGLIQACRAHHVPVRFAAEITDGQEVVQEACRLAGNRSQRVQAADPAMIGKGRVMLSSAAFVKAGKGVDARLFLLGGADTLQQPLGYLPVELAVALRGEQVQVSAWGDAAVWMMKSGLASPEADDSVILLDDYQGPLLAIKAQAASGSLKRLDGVCYTGLKDCRELNVALGLALLGIRVMIAVPLPIWGSEAVCSELAAILGKNGGSLIHYDHPAGIQEILNDRVA